MSALDLARWQFGITTVYHFIFVPLTIGLGFVVAGMQTAWYRTRKDDYLRMTRFFGKLVFDDIDRATVAARSSSTPTTGRRVPVP